MKKLSRFRFIGISMAIVLSFVAAPFAFAAQNKEARVTQVIRDVRLLPKKAGPRPATVNDNVSQGTAVRTGGDSRAELTFTDQSLTRLGANTIFSFDEGARQFNLSSGAILLAVPKSAGSIKVTTPAVTAGITGFTAMIEYHPKGWIKFIVLEGYGWMALKKNPTDRRSLGPGQILVFRANTNKLPQAYQVDLWKLINNSLFIKLFHKLPNWAWGPIVAEADKQKLAPPPPGGFMDPTSIDKIDQAAAAFPAPSPRHSEHPPGDSLRDR